MTQAEERRALLSKLAAMHDQFAHCMGRHPELLMLTPYSAEVLGWKVGDATPFYAEIGSVTEIRDYFDGGNAGPGDAASRSETSLPSLFKSRTPSSGIAADSEL